MNRNLHRIITLLLVPCLLGDPAIAFALNTPLYPTRERAVAAGGWGEGGGFFAGQALSPFSEFGNILIQPYFAVRHRVSRLVPLLLVGPGLAFSQAQIPESDPTSLSAQQEDQTQKEITADIATVAEGSGSWEYKNARLRLTRDGKAVPQLIQALESPNFSVALTAITLLAQTRDVRATKPLLDRARKEPGSFLSQEAIVALGYLGDPVAAGPIREMLRSGLNYFTITQFNSTAFVLFQLSMGRPLPELIDAMHDPDPRVASYLIRMVLDSWNYITSELSPEQRSVFLRQTFEAALVAGEDFIWTGSDGPPFDQLLLEHLQLEGDYQRILRSADRFEGENYANPYVEWALTQAAEKEDVSIVLGREMRKLKSYIPILSDLEPIMTDLSLSIPARIDGLINLKQQPAYTGNRLLELLMRTYTSDLMKNILFYYRNDFTDAQRAAPVAQTNARTLYTLLSYTESKLAPLITDDLLKRLRDQMTQERIDWPELYALHGDYRFWVFINHVNRLREATEDPSERKDLQQLLQTLRNVANRSAKAGLALPAVRAVGSQPRIRRASISTGNGPNLSFNTSKGFNRTEQHHEELRYHHVAFVDDGRPIQPAAPAKTPRIQGGGSPIEDSRGNPLADALNRALLRHLGFVLQFSLAIQLVTLENVTAQSVGPILRIAGKESFAAQVAELVNRIKESAAAPAESLESLSRFIIPSPKGLREQFQALVAGLYPKDLIEMLKRDQYNPVLFGLDHDNHSYLPVVMQALLTIRDSVGNTGYSVAVEILPQTLESIQKYLRDENEYKERQTIQGQTPTEWTVVVNQEFRKLVAQNFAENLALGLLENGLRVIPLEHPDTLSWVGEDTLTLWRMLHLYEPETRLAYTAIRRDLHGLEVMSRERPDTIVAGAAHAMKYELLFQRNDTRTFLFGPSADDWIGLMDFWKRGHDRYREIHQSSLPPAKNTGSDAAPAKTPHRREEDSAA